MKFAVYIPPAATGSNKVPALYWLSGLTCNEQNFIQKAGGQQHAAEKGLIIVCPDTSPSKLCKIPHIANLGHISQKKIASEFLRSILDFIFFISKFSIV